jgi:DNA-binding CsgD family transcriptional regulator
VLYGRAKERAALDALLSRAQAGQGSGAVLRGEPGIGKTALLGYAAEHAGGFRVLHTAGVEPESDLGYATLHRLLLPVLDRADQLPEPQARALDVAFGRATGPVPDRFLVALATLSLLSEVAGDQPLLCLVDDAHWADRPSLSTVAFVARRLDAEPIALVLAARADEGRPVDAAGLVDLPLAGLDRDAAEALLAARNGPPGADRAERFGADRAALLRATGGNPLAIRELPASAVRVAGAGEPLPLVAGLQRAFLDRARQRDTAAQRLLLLVATGGTGRPDTIRRAEALLSPGADPYPTGELADLLVEDGPVLAFRHPLMRSAVYHGAQPDQRRAAHRALAMALVDEPAELDRRAWHLGQAAESPDEQVAAQLERSAEQALRRAGPTAAAAALDRAAELSERAGDRSRRAVAAAAAWWQGGDAVRAGERLEQAERSGPEAVRLDLAGLRALIELRAGTPAEAVGLLRPIIPEALRGDRHQAVRLLLVLGEATFHANMADPYAEIAAALEDLPLDGDEPDDVLTRLFRAACRVRTGRAPGLHHGDLAAVERLTDPAMLGWAGGMAIGLGDPELARRLWSGAVRQARALGAAGTLAWALEYLVADELGHGQLDTAEAHAEEGYQFAEESGQPNTACRHLGWLAVLAALRGREDEARRLADDALARAYGHRLVGATTWAYRALSLLDLAAGRPADALAHLEAIDRGAGTTHPGIVLTTVPDLVEVAVRADRPDRATAPFARYTTWAEATGSPAALAVAARCRALLAAADPAEDEYLDALRLHAQADEPLEHARTRLLFGQHLRRQRRRADARPHLRLALETFSRLGATVWADRAAEELRATGEASRRRPAGALADLTPQELRIVRAVSEGATNREIAAALFLSPRTVDYHLRKVFQKTGVSSRAELIRLRLNG